jgi:hypothetical protein
MACCSATRVYRPRQPQATQLYRAVRDNIELFYDTYDERFLAQHGPLTRAARKSFEAFLSCGCLQAGFARLRCEACGTELLVAFSCQKKGPCPSCQQKRAEILCRFVQEEVIEPVDHRQLVFVVPKMFRRHFLHDSEMLTGLCRAAADATQQFYRSGMGRGDVTAGLILHPQLFGDKLNPHPHLHGICTDGAFDPHGNFHRLPFDMQDDVAVLQKLLERNVLDLLVEHGRLSQRLRDDMLINWKHTGFSTDASVRIVHGDDEGIRRLVRYIARPPVSFERVTYDDTRHDSQCKEGKWSATGCRDV